MTSVLCTNDEGESVTQLLLLRSNFKKLLECISLFSIFQIKGTNFLYYSDNKQVGTAN